MSEITKYLIETEVAEGDTVYALNYRKRPAKWELGKVVNVKASLRNDGTARLSFDILLDRRSISKWGKESVIRLYLGTEGVRPVTNPQP